MLKEKHIYNVAIIGAGNISSGFDDNNSDRVLTHAHAIKNNAKFNLLGFYDINDEKLELAIKKWNCKKLSLDDVYKADVVVIATPDEYHKFYIDKLIDTDVKFIIAEKPLVSNLVELREIKDKIINKNIILNYSRRFIDEFKHLNYGKLLKGNAYYGKGFIHNGSHMLDLIEKLGFKIEKIEVNNIVNDYIEKTIDAKLLLDNGIINLNAIDSTKVTIFELDLLFEKKRVIIKNSGMNIEYYNVIESDIFKGYYNYVLDKSVNIDYSNCMINLYEKVYHCLENNVKHSENLDLIEKMFMVLEND